MALRGTGRGREEEKPYPAARYTTMQQLDDSTFTSTILKIEGGERFSAATRT